MHRFITAGFHVCGDVFFSGHMAVCVLFGMVWQQYTTDGRMKTIIWVAIWMEACFLLSTRFHYTIDIVIGGYMSLTLWRTYHSYLPFINWLESAPSLRHLQGSPAEINAGALHSNSSPLYSSDVNAGRSSKLAMETLQWLQSAPTWQMLNDLFVAETIPKKTTMKKRNRSRKATADNHHRSLNTPNGTTSERSDNYI